MATKQIEVCEDDIIYYIEDQFGNEIGFAIEENGKEVEYYYAKKSAAKAEATTNETANAACDGTVNSEEFAASEQADAGQANADAVKIEDVAKTAFDNIKKGEPVVTRENVSNAAKELNRMHRENAEIAESFREVGSMFKDGMDFLKDPLGLKTPPRTNESPQQ